MLQAESFRAGTIVLFVGALVGVIDTLFAYFAPLTGVTGTVGALAAIVASACLALMAVVLAALTNRLGRNIWRVLIFILLVATFVAGLLLHEWWLCAGMVIGLIGLITDVFYPARARGAVYS